ncbi:MAG: hypothetical protein RLO12_08080 [Fulvivirga sp.]|uniref:hypothetical protein n=1 Tax=Marivirga tractuosa TaxID=1006 RepID=UPI0032FB35A3
MKKLNKIVINFFTLLIMVVLTSSCSNQSQKADQDHGEMMDSDQTEMMEGDNDHMHEEGQSDEHMLNDTTSMEMNGENESMMND